MHQVSQHTPLCFRDFQNVKVILDCTEVPVQKQKTKQNKMFMLSNTMLFALQIDIISQIYDRGEPSRADYFY